MLGLGNSITTGGAEYSLGGTYTSDFTTGTDGWEPYSVEGTLTLLANQTIDSTGGWLKGIYDTNQTNASGVQLNPPFSIVSGMDLEISYKVYIPNLGGSEWLNAGGSGAATDPDLRVSFSGGFKHDNLSYNTTTSITATDTTVGATNFIEFNFAVIDKPQDGAVFYIKDIIYTVS
tara:strand:- start:2252 stop:2776 length:525 start_codon:yes stop_codon:yes gene_type:complete